MDHFDDDDPDAADSSNDTVDSVNEEWDSEGMPSDPSDPRDDFVEPDQSQRKTVLVQGNHLRIAVCLFIGCCYLYFHGSVDFL